MNLLGLDMDSRPSEISEGYYSYGKNGLLDYIDKTASNEFGFRKLNISITHKIIGTIETGDNVIVFSTNNTVSEIGIVNLITETYNVVINDTLLLFKFNFNLSNPIKGEFQKNYNNEIIVCFKDNVEPPKLINVTNNKALTYNDYLLFPSWNKCKIETNVLKGGNLIKGCYIPVVRYIKDGLFTDYFMYGNPCYIGNDNNGQIIVNLSNLDINYNKVQLAFLIINEGITKVVELNIVALTTIVKIVFTGSYKDEISFDSFFAVTPYYTNFKAITQLEDELYAGNLQEYNQNKVDYYMQKASLKATLKWKSTLIKDIVDNFNNNNDYLAGKYKGFFHQEVYCFYIVGNLRSGRKTKAYIIANREPQLTELFNTLMLDGTVQAKRFQVEDTIDNNNVDLVNRVGEFGYWENQNETYPTNNIEGFGNPFDGYSGKSVKHFKTPSQNLCYNLFYSNEDLEYGSKNLDVLNVIVDSFVIPNEIINEVVSYELCYAKRNQIDITNVGQSLFLLGSNANNQNNIINMTSTGGNFNYDGYGTNGSADRNNYLKERVLRFHSFDMLFNKLAIKPDIIVNQLKLTKKIVTNTPYVSDINSSTSRQDSIDGILNEFGNFDSVFYKERSIYLLLDYTSGKSKVKVENPSIKSKNRKLKNFKFNPNNSYSGDIDNRLLEGCYTAELEGLDLSSNTNWAVRNADNEQTLRGDEKELVFPLYETTYLSNLIRIVTDVFINYYNQEIVSTQITNTKTSSIPLFGGDCFISDYSFVTYGKRDIFDKGNIIDSSNRFIHRFICESASNINLRYQRTGDIYSNFYPKSYGNWIRNLDKNLEPNNFGYDKELNKLIEQVIVVYNPFIEYRYKFPFKIIKSSQLNNKEKTERSWRNFAPLDSFEMPKNYDEIVNLQGFGDKLLIHMKNMLFLTRDKGRLDLMNLNVVLGSGDIFAFNPLAVSQNNLGLAGTKQDIGLLVSPLGYHFIDNGVPYVFNDKLDSLSNKMTNFLNLYLKTNKNNPYIQNGILFGYDNKYKRILMTLKNGDKSFTLSYSIEKQNWVFFHDYIPDMYIHSRDNLYSIKDNQIFINSDGVMGNYYEGKYLDDSLPTGTYSNVVFPFFIDIVFKQKNQGTLNSVNWVTNSINNYLKNEVVNENTITHLTIRNNEQHSGRILLTNDVWYKSDLTKLKDIFSFNNFNNVISKDTSITLGDVFKDYLLLNRLSIIEWYKLENMYSYYNTIRFEYDNKVDNILLLKEAFVNQQNQ